MVKGAGIGLRQVHFDALLKGDITFPWYEVLADHYLDSHGYLIDKLLSVLKNTPRVMHCTGLSIAGTDPLNLEYLNELKRLSDIIKPQWISDHLSASQLNGVFYPELLPFPLSHEFLEHVCRRVDQVQNFLKKPFLLENTVFYAFFNDNELCEAEFLATVAIQTGCRVLLDVNNIYVNHINHQLPIDDYFMHLTPAMIKQIHLAGHVVDNNFLIDTHSRPVPQPVWDLYCQVTESVGQLPTCIEWDADIPALQVLKDEADKIEQVLYETC